MGIQDRQPHVGPMLEDRAAMALLSARGWRPFFGPVTGEHRCGIAKGDTVIRGDSWDELAWKARVADAVAGRTFMLESEYRELFGHAPIQDELLRVTCADAGAVGHFFCGVCAQHASPRFMCGCVAPQKERSMSDQKVEFLSCKHVAADAETDHAYLLIETRGSQELVGARICADCTRWLRDVVAAEPIAAVTRVSGQ